MALTKLTTPEQFDFSDLNTALQLPTGTTLERPTSPSTGEWRYNTDEKYVEFWDGSAWRQIDTEGASIGDPSENFNVSTYFGQGATQKVDAQFNEAASFLGTTSRIDITSPIGQSLSNENDDFSVSLWVSFNSITSSAGAFNGAIAGNNAVNIYSSFAIYAYGHASGLSLAMERYFNDTGYYHSSWTTAAPFTAVINTWYNIVTTYVGSTKTVTHYVDGTSVGSYTLDTNAGARTMNPVNSFGSYNGSSSGLAGKLDQIRIFNTALTATEAEDCYTDETTTTAASLNFPVGAGCVAAYPLDGDTSDLSDNYPGSEFNIGYTGLRFSPDLVWIKKVNSASSSNHMIFDTVRGPATNLDILYPDLSNASDPGNSIYLADTISAGFTVGSSAYTGGTGDSLVAYSWKGGGAPDTDNLAGVGAVPTPGSAKIDGANSTDTLTGTIAAKRMSVNTASGFSIVRYDGNGLQNATVDSGLQTQSNLVIIKNINQADAWFVGSTELSTNNFLELNEPTDATTNSDLNYTINAKTIEFTSASPHDMFNENGENYIMYSFQNINGYQRVDTYTGSSDEYGPIIYTTSDGTSSGTDGFEPAFVMIKCTNFGSNTDWVIFDNKRNLGNLRRDFIYANSSAAEATAETLSINFYSNGFQPIGSDGTHNASGKTYLYLAIGADPYTTTPSATNSFGLTLNTSPATDYSVFTTFKPENSWIKGYTNSAIALAWGQYDLLRGSGVSLQSDNSGAESDYYYHGSGNLAMLFTDGGYLQPPITNNNVNSTSHDYISYFWRLGGKQTINNDGTSTSVVTANPASGCSIAILNQPDTTARNFGHGLDGVPEMMILKRLESSDDWNVYHSALGNGTRISMNESNAKVIGTGVWDSTTPTSDVFYLQNQTGGYHICYLFRSITGVQSVGSYEGNQATGVDNQIDFGFAPRFVLIKNADSGGSQWMLFDSARTNGYALYVNDTGIEQDHTADLTLSSQGLRFGSTNINVNQSGDTYIYLAIA